MFRSKRKNKEAPEPEEAPRASMPPSGGGGYQTSQLVTFDGKGNSRIIVYSRDATGRTIKTPGKLTKGGR